MTARHRAWFRGWRPFRVTVTCTCGWVREHCFTRAAAADLHDAHVRGVTP